MSLITETYSMITSDYIEKSQDMNKHIALLNTDTCSLIIPISFDNFNERTEERS